MFFNVFLWKYCFFNVDFRVKNVWMYNFSGMDEDEFALAASFVIHGKIMEKLMIKTSSV
ncbi:hypothetical protein HID58_045978 [Brassica napus]|uniref:Uncharacterized protein n=1 Tax=Brassica napus TaxID=3708 RepID=A0ABQ8AWJ3_BRANA|nr:hypothetical protein HID58_045978 [Brassica napus]